MGLFARPGSGPQLPQLPSMPSVKDLPEPVERNGARYLGTLDGGRRVRARGLGPTGSARIQLSFDGVDVVRLAGSFRIPVPALRSARESLEFAGKDVAEPGALVLRWEHGGSILDTGFRLQPVEVRGAGGKQRAATPAEVQRRWTRAVHKMVRNTDG